MARAELKVAVDDKLLKQYRKTHGEYEKRFGKKILLDSLIENLLHKKIAYMEAMLDRHKIKKGELNHKKTLKR
jgi:hypothetical protein